ncbi:hypothetical protein ACT7DJ_33775 [Bacillus cereus]
MVWIACISKFDVVAFSAAKAELVPKPVNNNAEHKELAIVFFHKKPPSFYVLSTSKDFILFSM